MGGDRFIPKKQPLATDNQRSTGLLWIVRKVSKIFLILFVVALLVGLTDVGSSSTSGLLLPMSAVFFMLFFILHLFAKEFADYDEEQRSRLERAQRNSASPETCKPNQTSSGESRPNSCLAAAHSH